MMGKMEIRSPPGSRPRDGRHCDLCGCSQPAVRCDKCGCQIFCLSCDDMYHRHPKRRFHLRKAVDPIPPVPQARPVLPMKVSHLNATNPGDPSKMPLPPPRKKKSLFSSFRKPSGDNSPPLPKKEYSWTDRLGSIKKFMSNRPLPPLPTTDDNDFDSQPATNGQDQRGDLSFIHKRTDDRPPQLPQRSPRSPDFPGISQEKENRIPSTPPHLAGQIRNGSLESHPNHVNHEFNNNDPNLWNNQVNHHNNAQPIGTLNRQRPFMPPGAPGYPGGMHQSSSATDLHNLQNAEGMHGPVPPHYPHYPMNPHMPPHYPYPVYPGYPNYPQYFGNSFANLSNPPTSEGDFSDSESSSRHSSKRHAFRKRAKRSQSVVVDRMAYPGQFYPFGPYPGYGPWGAPMPMETPPSPASSIRSLNRTGRTRRRKKGTSEDDDEDLSETSSPMSRPKSSSSDPKEHPRAPLATQTTSSEDESDNNVDKRRNKINTIRRQSDPPMRSPSPVVNKNVAKLKKSSSKQSDSDSQDGPATRSDRRSSDSTTDQRQPVRQSPIQQQPTVKRSPTPQQAILRESPVAQPTQVQPQTSSNSAPSAPSDTWECRHCTYVNPIGNRICQVCCKTATPRTETPVSGQSRPSSSSARNRKDSVGSENEYFVPDEKIENEASKKDTQDMASLNSALDEAEKQISKGLEELMKLKDDIDSSSSKEKPISSEMQSKTDSEIKPVYKSSGRMRTSILDKLNLNKSQGTNASVSTSTETQTDQSNRTIDKIIEARRLSNSSSASETYNSPLAQSPELDTGYQGNRQKRDSSCQTQQDSIAEYLEKRKAAEEAFLGRPINNFGFSYGDRMDMMTSPVPSMYDRFYGGGYGMQRSHSRASLFTGRMNDFGPMEYGPGPGFGYGPGPMYRSVSRGSLTGDYPDGRVSGFHNIRKPDYYLSMEELVERRCQDNINNIRAQGLELVRMIREAEQQGFNADDIQVALTHCGKQNPLEWLQENWRNMVDSVVTLSTNYGNDKKENDIGLLSESESRDALRLHKGNIWAAVTECVEGRQRKYLELSARGNFCRQDIVDALTSSDGDVEMAYAKLTKSIGKPFLMRIWGQGEGVQNQDGARPMTEDYRDGPRRYLKDETLNNDDLSDDLWSDDGAVDWDDEDEYEEERGDIEDLRTCQEDLPSNPDDVTTPESERSEYCDAFSIDDRNVSSPSDDIFFVIPEAKPEKKKGFLSKLVALRKDSKEHAETTGKEGILPQQKEDTTSQKITTASEQKNSGALNTLKNKFSAIKDTVTGGGAKNDKKAPSAQLDRRTIIVRGQLEHESLSSPDKEDAKLSPTKNESEQDNSKTYKSDIQSTEQEKRTEASVPKEITKSSKINDNKTTIINETEDSKIKMDRNVAKIESKPADSMKAENKSSQSLTERLKSAKQASTPFDAPGPSGIKKESLKQLAETKQDTLLQPQKETSFQKQEKLKIETNPIKEQTLDKTNADTIPNLQNLKQSEPKETTNQINKNNQVIDENIANKKAVTLNDDQPTKFIEVKNIPHVPSPVLSKESNVSTNESSKTGALRSKTPTSNVSENIKQNSEKTPTKSAPNKTSSVELESSVNSKKFVSSTTTKRNVNEIKPNSVSMSEKDKNKDAQISEINKQRNTSEANTSNTISDLSENNASPELKSTDYRKEKSEVETKQSNKLSLAVSSSDNKTPTLSGKIEKDENNIDVEFSKLNSVKVKLTKEESKLVQKTENDTNNIETDTKISELQKSEKITKTTESMDNQTSVEKPQKLLEEDIKFKTIASTKEESLITENNENVSKNTNTVENIPTENTTPNDIPQTSKTTENVKAAETPKTAASEEILNSKESPKIGLYEEIPKPQSDISSDHNKHKSDVLAKSDQALTDSDVNKNVKEANVFEIPEQNMEINLEQSKPLTEIKSITQSNENIAAASSSMSQEDQSTEAITEHSKNQLKVDDDKLKVKSLSDEASSSNFIPNEANTVQTLNAVNQESVSAISDHTENFPQKIIQESSAAQDKDSDILSVQNLENISKDSHDVNETKKDDKDNTFMTQPENSKNLLVNSVIDQSEKAKDEVINLPKDNAATNLVPSDSGLPNLVPDSNSSVVDEGTSLKNTVEIPNKNATEQPKNELSDVEKVLSKEDTAVTNSINSELESAENKETLSSGETNLEAVNAAIGSVQVDSFVKNGSTSVENQAILTTAATPSKTGEGDLIPNASEIVKEQGPEATSISSNINSSEVIKKETSKETELQAPVFSKEFPTKSTVENSESSTLSDNSEIATVSSLADKSVNSESPPSAQNTNVPDSLKLSDTDSTTNTTDNVKTSEASLSTSNLENVPSSSKEMPHNSETVIEQTNVPVDSTVDTSIAQTSVTENKSAENTISEVESSNAKIIESSKTAQNSSNTSIDNTSVPEKITSDINNSIEKASSNIAIADTASTSSSINSNVSVKSKTITSLPDASAVEKSQTTEIPISELSNTSTDVKSLNKSSTSAAPEANEQHSKVPETVSTKSSASTSVSNYNTLPRRSSLQNRQLQRTISEERKGENTSESDGSDTEYSSNSRRGSLILPSPVDTLRSRFEGLASSSGIRDGPVRPASPFRRMSFNSRKQVIALERKRDTAVDKPWFHKMDPEPVKIVQPKRSLKQQLEMERKVRKMVADRKCRTYKKAEIVVQLMDMNFEEEEAIQAANECNTLEQAISYLQQECQLCAGHFPVSQIVSMTHCEHRACYVCIRAYFTVQIRDRTILDLLCPFCNEPDIGDEDVAQDYFNHLDIMLKKLVDTEIHELFQRKLRDRVLMKDPNFRWCSQCSSGFIAMPNLKRLICPDCNAVTCAFCRRLWEKEHQGISCEAFAALKDASDPEAQAAGLAKMLTEDGISCPSCHFRYALAKGGCMHFRCIQCQHDFCSGCSRPFKMGQKCGVSEFCAKLGLHAHHPRNCLFYLRDKEPEDLQKLLDMNDVNYNTEPPDGMEVTSTCQVLEQKETTDGMVDDSCGKEVQEGFAGLCRVHYVEYLGQLVNKHKVDPIQIFDNDDLELVLKRANVRLPPKRYRENDIQYREKLIKVIQEELPLDRMDGS